MKKRVTQISSKERKKEFELFLEGQVKSAQRYITAMEKGFAEGPVGKYKTIFDITDPELFEDLNATKALRDSKTFSRSSKGGTAGLAGLNRYIRFLKDSRDSYYDFMNHFSIKPKELFNWGKKATIFPEKSIVRSEWDNLKYRVFNKGEVRIRGYGRDAHGTQLYIDFYKHLFSNENIKRDSNSNYRPRKNLEKMVDLRRNKDIYNYQVSHIWGHTKNVFLFEAPWNICFTPKIIDPLTGHETKGDLPEEFQMYFQQYARKKYKEFIDDYNSIIGEYDIELELDKFCKANGIDDERFKKDALKELSPIELI